MDESSLRTHVESSIKPIAESPVRNSFGNYGNGDENLCSIQPHDGGWMLPDGNNDQYDLDMNDQNTTIGTHREARIQDVGGRETRRHRKTLIQPKMKW